MRFYPTVNNNNNNTPVIPGADMPAIQSKLAGYWVDGEDQLSTSNLVDSGTSYTMPVSSELINATGLISLNTWFISGVAQAINKTSISNYCAGKQFYGNDTLIILKKDNYLTEAEETALLTHLEITAVHSYHANSTALFSRFTNTYSNNEKSRLDNVMRHLVNSGIYAATDHFYLALTSKGEEMRLDWINASNNLTNNGYSVYEVPYKGLAPQKGTYYTGANPDADSNISQNSAYLSFKMKYPFSQPQANYVFGAGATGVSGSIGMRPYYGTVSIGQGYDIRLLNNNPFYISIPSGKGYESTMVTNRTGAEITNFYAEGSNIGSSNAISYAPTTSEIKIGGEIAIRGNSNSNYVQHLAWGSELTAEQSILLTKIIDDFAEHQKYLDTEYIEVNGIKITPLKHGFKCVLGQQCIWNDLNTVYYSNDLGETVASSIALPTYGKQINFAHIFDNGKIIFGTVENRMFTTTTALSSLTEMTPTKNGSTYTLHTPIDANYQDLTIKV